MIIREYKNSDEKAVISLWESVFQYNSSYNDPLLSINNKVKMNDGLFLVAEINFEVVGSVMGGYDGHRGWIYSLAVKKDFQGRGIAVELLNIIIDKLKNMGCPKVNLQILSTNSEVVEFYNKNGFEVEERISMGKKLI